jgi:hypothetical protein
VLAQANQSAHDTPDAAPITLTPGARASGLAPRSCSR